MWPFDSGKRPLVVKKLQEIQFGGTLKGEEDSPREKYLMKLTKVALAVLAIPSGLWVHPVSLYGQSYGIDVTKSSLKVRVFKSGLFSAFAHDHEIEAPIDEGTIDSSTNPSVRLVVDARKMRVLDPEISFDKRCEIQRTMQSSSVLDSEHFPEISFQSTRVKSDGNDYWEVDGNLSLHGRTQPIVVAVALKDGHYRGSVSFKQSAFGISPIRIAGGTVKVKDEVKIEFDITPELRKFVKKIIFEWCF
jgi:polyisoprenoid-binding protein YceI